MLTGTVEIDYVTEDGIETTITHSSVPINKIREIANVILRDVKVQQNQSCTNCCNTEIGSCRFCCKYSNWRGAKE